MFSRHLVEHNFAELIKSVKDVHERDGAPPEALQETVTHFEEIERDVLAWLDGDSPLGCLERYLEMHDYRKPTRSGVKALANAYMRYTQWQPDFSEDEAIRFLLSRDTKKSSRKTYLGYLRIFFRANHVRKADLPFEDHPLRLSENEQPHRRTLPFEKVRHFIGLVRRSNNPRAAFYAALITTWGFRPVEMGATTIENINAESHTIELRTAKRGRVRIHHIPEPIRPYVYGYDAEPVKAKQMNRLWQYVCRDVGFRPPRGYGWYGIRHALFTRLANTSGIPGPALDKWGGWRTGVVSGGAMINTYNAPDTSDLMAIDKLVLSKHPFLGFWDGSNG